VNTAAENVGSGSCKSRGVFLRVIRGRSLADQALRPGFSLREAMDGDDGGISRMEQENGFSVRQTIGYDGVPENMATASRECDVALLVVLSSKSIRSSVGEPIGRAVRDLRRRHPRSGYCI